jgi:hypothetical protein
MCAPPDGASPFALEARAFRRSVPLGDLESPIRVRAALRGFGLPITAGESWRALAALPITGGWPMVRA